MILTKREVITMKATYKTMIENPTCHTQYILAHYWLERLERKGKYAMMEDKQNVVCVYRRTWQV